MAKRAAEFQLTKELSVSCTKPLSSPTLEEAKSYQDEDEATENFTFLENENEVDRSVKQKKIKDTTEGEDTCVTETIERKPLLEPQSHYETEGNNKSICSSLEKPGIFNSVNLPKASVLTESTEFRNPFTLYAEQKEENSFFLSKNEISTVANKDTENCHNGTSNLLIKDERPLDSTNFSTGIVATTGTDETAINDILSGSSGQKVYFSDSMAKFSRFNSSEPAEWILPVAGKLTIAGNEENDNTEFSRKAPHITFHQHGTGRLLLNTDILKASTYRIFKQRSAMFLGRSIGDTSQLSVYRITFNTMEKRNLFMKEVESIQQSL